MQDNLQVTMDEFLPLRDVVFNTLALLTKFRQENLLCQLFLL